MNVRSCEYLIAIAEKGTLSRAANSLGISQPTLSSFLSNTERQLGRTLFVRYQNAMVPTEAGRLYLEACQRIVETKKRTYHSIFALCNNFSERLTVGVTPHRGSTLFARIYSRFYQRYPNVAVDLREGYIGTLLEYVDTGEIDLVIGAAADEMMEKYSVIRCNKEEVLLCVPTFHPLAELAAPEGTGYASISVRRFQDTPFVMWGEQTSNWYTVRKLLRESGMSPTVVYESNNVLLIDSMLSSGAGVGFLPIVYCKPDQNRVYFVMDPPLKNVGGLYYQKGVTLTEAQRYFVYLSLRDQLVNSVSSLPCLNDAAERICKEFEEAGDGYATT